MSRREWLRDWGGWLRHWSGEAVAGGEHPTGAAGSVNDCERAGVTPVPMPREKSLAELWPAPIRISKVSQ
ncbi:MAG: hypothetical protein HY700_10560 [Gemmatimonadetes bacterium]|nr:hypothetical protein [Gemmatimonadota bacterium]